MSDNTENKIKYSPELKGLGGKTQESRDESKEFKDKQTADNASESVNTNTERPIRQATDDTQNGVHYEAESRNGSEELKYKQTTDNVVENAYTTKECTIRHSTDDTEKGEHYEAKDSGELKDTQTAKNDDTTKEDQCSQATDDPQNEEYFLNKLEQRFRDGVQNYLAVIELLSRTVDEWKKESQKILNTGDFLLKKGRAVENDLNQLNRKWELFLSKDAFNRPANTSNKYDWPDPNYVTPSGKPDHFSNPRESRNESSELNGTDEETANQCRVQLRSPVPEGNLNKCSNLEDTRQAINATESVDTDEETAVKNGVDLRCQEIEPSVNRNVMQTSRKYSSQSVTELIEDMFGTQSGVRRIVYSGYICIYNSERRLGITYEYLKKDNLLGDACRKRSFKRDKDVGISGPNCNDFRMNNYHTGHLAASGNYKNSQDQTNDTFYLTNAVPQKTKGRTWEKIEIYAWDLLEKHKNESLLVITGWLMMEKDATVTHEKHNMLSVPTHLFKILITVNEKKADGIAVFIIPNNPNEGSCLATLVLMKS